MFNYLKEPKWMNKWLTHTGFLFIPIYTTSKEYYKCGFCIDFNAGWFYRCVKSSVGIYGLTTCHIWNMRDPKYIYSFLSKEKVIDMDRIQELMKPYLLLFNL